MVKDASSNEDKQRLCEAILENSLVIPDNYRDLIVETLMRIPENDLCKIQLILDRFIFIAEGTSGASEHFLWQCMAKHKMKRLPPLFDGDKITRIPKPETFDTFAIILIEHELNKMSEEGRRFVVAHELAHVFLKHRTYGSKVKADLKIEEKANRQVKKWGFKVFARGTDYPNRRKTVFHSKQE